MHPEERTAAATAIAMRRKIYDFAQGERHIDFRMIFSVI
jgi:hypothetical protein